MAKQKGQKSGARSQRRMKMRKSKSAAKKTNKDGGDSTFSQQNKGDAGLTGLRDRTSPALANPLTGTAPPASNNDGNSLSYTKSQSADGSSVNQRDNADGTGTNDFKNMRDQLEAASRDNGRDRKDNAAYNGNQE